MTTIKDNESETVAATTNDEIKKLGSLGFQEYGERKIRETCISYYRSPKIFSTYGA